MRFIHSGSSSAPAAVATYRTEAASATSASANADLPERMPPSTRAVFHRSTDMTRTLGLVSNSVVRRHARGEFGLGLSRAARHDAVGWKPHWRKEVRGRRM